MSEKLTAKLSDGREYEVVNVGDTPKVGFGYLSVVPIKPQPPKEIWLQTGSKDFLGGYAAYENKSDADVHGTPCARYVLAEDKHEKPKREPEEWYEIRASNSISYASNLEDAKRLKTVATRIFLVREVLE